VKFMKFCLGSAAVFLHLILWGQTADITQGCVPLRVAFTAPTGMSTYYWDFKDGASSILQNPSNLFINPGTYSVDLRASAAGAVVGSITINVYPKPTPTIITDSVKNIGCKPYTLNLRGSTNILPGVTVTGYNWTFGDGVAGTGQNTSHTYTQPGFYAVGMEVMSSTPNCNVTLLKDSFVIVSGFSGSASASPLGGCTTPHNVSFSNTLTNFFPIKSYAWTFGDGITSNLKIPPSKNYPDTGTYQIGLVATDTFGCKYNYTGSVVIQNYTADFTSNDTVCVSAAVILKAKLVPSATYIWSLNGATTTGSNNVANTYAIYTTPGVYSVTLFTLLGSCAKAKTKFVHVIKPTVRFDVIPDSVCSKNFSLKLVVLDSAIVDSVQWFFSSDSAKIVSRKFNENSSNFLPFDTITWGANQDICMVAYTKYGCTVTQCQAVYFPSIAHVAPSVSQGCAPLTVEFTNKSYSVFPLQNWTIDYGDGSPISTIALPQRTITHTYTNPGNYAMRIWIRTQNGCIDTSYTTMITVGKLPQPTFTLNKTSVCPGEAIQLTNTSLPSEGIDQWHYWADGLSNFSCDSLPNNTIQFNQQTGTQIIEMEVGNAGCFGTISKTVFVNGPIAKYRFKQYCDSIYVADFIDQSQLATRLLYSFGDGSTSTLPNPRHRYTADGVYIVTLIAYNDTNVCAPDTFRQVLTVSKPIARFAMDENQCKAPKITLNASTSSGLLNTGCKLNYTWLTTPPNRTRTPTYGLADLDTGSYNVGVVVENAIGCTDTAYYSFRVNKILSNFKISDSLICLPQAVTFDASLSTNARFDSISWQIGRGNFLYSGTDSITHLFTTLPNGIDTVFLFARDTFGCMFRDTIVIRSYLANPSIIVNSSFFCTGDTIELSASNTSNLNFVWNFGDGRTSTTLQNKVVYKDTSGVIIVSMQYADKDNTVCTGTTSVALTINKKPEITIQSSADAAQEFCFPLSAKLTYSDTNNTGANNPVWTLNGTTNYFLDSISITFPRGRNTVSLILSDNFGCADTVVRVFDVIGPRGDFFTDTNNICVNDDIVFTIKDTFDVSNFLWDFGDGTNASNVSPVTHRYTFVPIGGSTKAKLTFTGAGGFCPYSVEKNVFLKEVFADFERNLGDTAICFGEQYLLKNTSLGADSYLWDFGNGTSSSQRDVNNFNYTTPGIYTISLAIKNNQFGCKDTVQKEVIVSPNPSAYAIGDTICLGSEAFVYAVSQDTGISYIWSPAAILNPATDSTSSGFFTNTTPILLTVTNTAGCIDTSWTTVFVILPPQEVLFDTIVPIGSQVILPFAPQFGYGYTWLPDTGLSCFGCAFPSKENTLTKQQYEVTFSDTILFCFSGKSMYLLDVFPETFIKVPNTFTPNNDGNNDIIYAEGWGVKKLLYFRIYNRWGELVFETNDMNVGWNGRYKGVIQSDDIFQYKVEGLDYFDRSLVREGFIHLMH
jgi:gliding motility-associated-like protein